MAQRTKEELLDSIRTIVGENTTDEVLGLLDDISDTYDSLSTDPNEDWKKKYEDNDKAWRTKYRERFFNGKDDDEDDEEDNGNDRDKYRYENLFKEG